MKRRGSGCIRPGWSVGLAALGCAAGLFTSGAAHAVTDEIQVYTGDIEAPGTWGLTWHNNYTASGLTVPAFTGGLTDDRAYSSVLEWAYGVTPWFEAGLYLPLYSNTRGRGWTYNGFKLRALFVKPHSDDQPFYYGLNFEFSWNGKQWERPDQTGEIRPILGYRWRGWSLTVNPIIDNSYKGFSRLDFAPATRLDYRLNRTFTLAAEEYDDFGELRKFAPSRDQFHQLWAVVDYTGAPVSIETGVGFGLTPQTDRLAFKLMLMSDLSGRNGILGDRF